MNGGRSTSGGGLENPMLPSQHQQPPKRKISDDGIPLAAAAKRAKKDAKSSNKRKLAGGEQLPGGLVIVRAPPSSTQSHNPPAPTPSRPPSSQSNHRPPSATPATSNPPAKKFKADTNTRTNGDQQAAPRKFDTNVQQTDADPSRPPSQLNRRQTSTTPAPAKKPKSDSNSRVVGKSKERELHAVPRDEPEVDADVRQMESETDVLRRRSEAGAAGSSSFNPAFQFPPAASKPKKYPDMIQPLPDQDTPQMERNKILRSENTTQHTQGHGRRRSSISGRGKRVSSSLVNTGVISQPHTSVADSSLYKHIDTELPEYQRASQLLIWCTSRASIPSDPSSSTQKGSAEDSGKDPPLSKEGIQALQTLKDEMMKLLAGKEIDTNTYSPHGSNVLDGLDKGKDVGENTQNVKNRAREIKFSAHIEKAKAEEVAWKGVENFYKSYRTSALANTAKLRYPQSSKAKGKQRATPQDLEDWMPHEDELSEEFRRGVVLARTINATQSGRQSPLSKRMEDLHFKVDHLHSFVNSAMQTTNVAESDLDYRFSLLSLSLSARSQLHPPTSNDPTSLSSFLSSAQSTTDPQDLLRALSCVDAERPPAQVGNAARRAAREVQRAHEQGASERRLTGVPPPTPRKAPGTPRRGTTPARDRER